MVFKKAILKAKLIGSAVESIDIIEPGQGYTSPSLKIEKASPPETATAKAIVENGSITKIEYINRGNGYMQTPEIKIEPPFSGTPAKGHITMSFGILDDIQIIEKGSGYIREPKVSITHANLAPTLCEAELEFNNYGSITNVNILSNGTGYKKEPNIEVVENESL